MLALLLTLLGACQAPLATVQAEAPRRLIAATPVCLDVAWSALQGGVSPGLATALALRESSLRPDVCSARGACGPLQAVPEYWCPGGTARGCDLTEAGVRALQHYLRRERGDVRRALCAYTGRRRCRELLLVLR